MNLWPSKINVLVPSAPLPCLLHAPYLCHQVWSSSLSLPVAVHPSLLPSLLPHQVGTLDSLVAMSDQFAKMDPYIEGMVQKIVKYIHDMLDPEDRVRVCV